MIEYYNEKYLAEAKEKRISIKRIYFVIVAVYLLVSVGIFVWYLSLPYKSPKIGVSKFIEYALTVIFVVFSFLYLGIKYKRIKKYHIFCANLQYGLKEQSEVVFLEFDENSHDKDGVDCKSLVCLEWNKYKQDYYERRVYVFFDDALPKIPAKSTLKVITQGNFLISYEIIENEGENE